MAHQIIALLVGINQYPDGVSNLRGCVQDVESMRDLLIAQYKVPEAHIMCLTNTAANRAEVIRAFRTHLSQAKAGDTVFFHYSGHGSRENAPQEFTRFNPNDKNQTLVLADSRAAGGLDLANKELAVLLQELGATKADLVLNIDACHSGGITRSEGDLLKHTSRQTEKGGSNRTLESYLDGHYSQMLQNTGEIVVPKVPHLVMSACTEYELAYETRQGTGAFSSALLQALQNPTLNYSQVFALARVQVKQWAFSQTPGATAYQGFSTMRQFLTHEPIDNPFKQSVYFLDGKWWMGLGAIQGMATDATQPTTLDIYASDQTHEVLGKGVITEVQPQKSVLEWQGFSPEESQQYLAQVSHLAMEPLAISNEGHSPTKELIDNALLSSRSVLVGLHNDLPKALYRIKCSPNKAYLYDGLSGLKLQGIKGLGGADLLHLVDTMEKVANWKRLLKLQNPVPKLNPDLVQLVSLEHQRGVEAKKIDYSTLYGNKPIQISLEVYNQLKQTMYFSLVEMSQDFGIKIRSETSAENAGEFTIVDKFRSNIKVDQNKYETWYTYLLIVSTEKLEGLVLTQEPVKLGQEVQFRGDTKGLASRSKTTRTPTVKDDWFTHRLSLKLVKELLELKPNPEQSFQIPESIVSLKGHAEASAWLCLESAFSQIRKEPAETLFNALSQCNWQAVNLLAGEQMLHVLTLSQLQNADKVSPNAPLELQLKVELAAGETLLAMAYYGNEVHTLGEASTSEGGVTTLALHQLPTHSQHPSICQICVAKGKKEELKGDLV